MTPDNWQLALYPLGYLATAAFTIRFFWQWIASEKAGSSMSLPSFWYLSLLGNLFLGLQAFIQCQLPLFLVQIANGAIAWRNLNLFERRPLPQYRFAIALGLCLALGAMAFCLYSYFAFGAIIGLRIPLTSWNHYQTPPLSAYWHLVGYSGVLIFNSRFWLQWLYAEKQRRSSFPASFWWLSLSGGIASLLYFSAIGDTVNALGPAFGLIPYLRNLMLQRSSLATSEVPK